MNEEWRDIPGYEGLYMVSNIGRVKRCAGSAKCLKDRILKMSKRTNGYLFTCLCRDGLPRQVDVHRLVMWAFVGEQGQLWVNHINGNKADNRLENLEYLTPGQNTKHAYDNGLMPSKNGEANPGAKATEEMVREIRRLYQVGVDRSSLVSRFGLSKTTIQGIVTRNSWRHVK